MNVTQEDKIRKSLSDYLEFNSDELFKSKFNLVRVFGGAIRDILAEQKINDVDILCGSKAIKYIESVLEQNGYQYMEMLNGKDLQEMYSEIHIINEPHTWIKGTKIVQLIRPSNFVSNEIDSSLYEEGFRDLISNVDLSCCGVSYDGENLYEDYPNAIVHCQSKVYSVNKSAKMYSERRINHRIHKLKDRGWEEIENKTNVNRDMKINVLFN
jgi:N-acetyl-beta-hexosaminidase